jgi:hypothetical protein
MDMFSFRNRLCAQYSSNTTTDGETTMHEENNRRDVELLKLEKYEYLKVIPLSVLLLGLYPKIPQVHILVFCAWLRLYLGLPCYFSPYPQSACSLVWNDYPGHHIMATI